MVKVPELNSFSVETGSTQGTGLMLHVVDTTDPTDDSTGSSFKLNLEEAAYAHIPSAEQLSYGSNLQDYIDRVWAMEKRPGAIPLPPGVIRLDRPLIFDRNNSIRLEGAGAQTRALASGSGWFADDINRSTRIYYQGPTTGFGAYPDNAAIIAKSQTYFDISHVTIEHPSGIGIKYDSESSGWGSTFGNFNNIALVNCQTGISCGDSGDIIASDAKFYGVSFIECNVGFNVRHSQGVAYSFSGQSFWNACETGILLEEGGNVYLHGCSANGGNTFLRWLSGGSNVSPCLINGFRMDKTGVSNPRILVDMRNGGEGTRKEVIIDGLSHTYNSVSDSGNGNNFPFFRIDNTARTCCKNNVIVRFSNLDDIFPLAYGENIGVYTDDNQLTGYLAQDGTYTTGLLN